MRKISKNFFILISKYGLAVAAITGAHNLFVEVMESVIAPLKTETKPLLEESENLHSSYTKMNVSLTLEYSSYHP